MVKMNVGLLKKLKVGDAFESGMLFPLVCNEKIMWICRESAPSEGEVSVTLEAWYMNARLKECVFHVSADLEDKQMVHEVHAVNDGDGKEIIYV